MKRGQIGLWEEGAAPAHHGGARPRWLAGEQHGLLPGIKPQATWQGARSQPWDLFFYHRKQEASSLLPLRFISKLVCAKRTWQNLQRIPCSAGDLNGFCHESWAFRYLCPLLLISLLWYTWFCLSHQVPFNATTHHLTSYPCTAQLGTPGPSAPFALDLEALGESDSYFT